MAKKRFKNAPAAAAFISSFVDPVEKGIENIPINFLQEYKGQPFKPYLEDKLQELADDIKENGLLSPLVVRKVNDKYEILAGNNRYRACKLNGMKQILCIVKDVDDNQAKLIMVNSNLNQRHDLLPSEKAFAYKIQQEILIKTTCRRTTAEIAENSGDNKRQIQRYIRLTKLIKPLLDMVDSGKFGFIVGVNLSFLTIDSQETLLSFMKVCDIQDINIKKSEELKNASDNISTEMLIKIFSYKSKTEKELKKQYFTFKIPHDLISVDKKKLGEIFKDEIKVKELSKLISSFVNKS